MKLVAIVLPLALAALPAAASELRFFGSAGVESRLTPANRSSPLNPGNVAQVPLQTNLADASAFAELLPESRRWKVRVKLRGDASDPGGDRLELGEAFVTLRPSPWFDVTAGRVIEKTGSGYGWTPSSFTGPGRDPTDPGDRRSSLRGVGMLRASFTLREANLTFYALDGGAYAARASRLFGSTDLSLGYRRDEAVERFGLSVSRVVGAALELHGEAARSGGVWSALAGGQFTFGSDTNVVVELYHSGQGLSAAQWDGFRTRVASATPAELLSANREYAPLRMGRNYAFVRMARAMRDGTYDAELLLITSLRDASTIVRATLARKVGANLSAYVIATEFLAPDGSELEYVQVKRVVTVGARVNF